MLYILRAFHTIMIIVKMIVILPLKINFYEILLNFENLKTSLQTVYHIQRFCLWEYIPIVYCHDKILVWWLIHVYPSAGMLLYVYHRVISRDIHRLHCRSGAVYIIVYLCLLMRCLYRLEMYYNRYTCVLTEIYSFLFVMY